MTTKLQRTRELLLATALELFEHDGYEATTAASIARAAGVSEMTFFRHFPAKELLLLDDPYDPLIAAAVRAQPRESAPLARTIAGIRVAWGELPIPDVESVRRRLRIAVDDPSLRPMISRNTAETERAIVEQLVADGADPIESRIVAAAVLAAVMASLLEWARADSGTLGDAVLRALSLLETA
ncbi:TetR/AcrR family transcriptional regulator [soil metagenome]